ncbi:O-antigen ligase-like membrane protein [Planomicrobium soli]|uniref:O-antigen ligase-like membrane protein n=1 Tax=Planomicrobium soli TaxID=1176648 RepID=A0A2P8H3A5_9BACL|nr:O-antigen ligase family protein [Planomicrobium soli]PSL40698.1 O-antigen ligase-like membrane protein [Planomicrobium soli]
MSPSNKLTNIELKEDYILSLSILSSFVVLSLQFFILYYFKIIGTSSGMIIQMVSKLVVGVIFIYSFPIVFKRNKILLISVYFVSLFVFLLNFLFFPQNTSYLKNITFSFFFLCLPCFIYSYSIEKSWILEKMMEFASLIVFFIGTIVGLLVLTNRMEIGMYSMSLSYYMLLPTLVFVRKFLDQYTIKPLVIFLISLSVILSFGSRGPLLSIGIFVLIFLIITIKKQTSKTFIVYIGILFMTILTLLYQKQILQFLLNSLERFNLSSRSLRLLLKDEVYLSGRDNIYGDIWFQIKQSPLIGMGLAGDRQYFGGRYTHNIVLEILTNFGVFVGLIIVVLLISLLLRAFLFSSNQHSKLILVWICLGFIPLLVSSSYLIDYSFWILLGISLKSITKRNLSDKNALNNF